MHSCRLNSNKHYTVSSRSVAAYCLAGVSRACKMIGCMLSLMRLGHLVVVFLPLKSEQINLIFSEENLQDEVLPMRG